MSEALRGIVVCHGSVARALVEAVEQISGIAGRLTPVSNSGCGLGELEQRVTEAIGDRPAVVFVDMPSSSCLFAALQQAKSRGDVRVVTGVNLAMLLDFVFHSDGQPAAAAGRAEGTGRKSIQVV
ncbi:MAG: PTS sugar transporter subunit IIA [Gemmatimonadota bacterium]